MLKSPLSVKNAVLSQYVFRLAYIHIYLTTINVIYVKLNLNSRYQTKFSSTVF